MCVCVIQWHSGDGCEVASNLFKYDLIGRSWTKMRRVRQGESVSSELLMCGGGVHSILLLSRVARI